MYVIERRKAIVDSNISPAGKNQDALPSLVIVGGFLGSGKTTLILKAADFLRRQGKRVAVILNDQDAGLVDTTMCSPANSRPVK